MKHKLLQSTISPIKSSLSSQINISDKQEENTTIAPFLGLNSPSKKRFFNISLELLLCENNDSSFLDYDDITFEWNPSQQNQSHGIPIDQEPMDLYGYSIEPSLNFSSPWEPTAATVLLGDEENDLEPNQNPLVDKTIPYEEKEEEEGEEKKASFNQEKNKRLNALDKTVEYDDNDK